MPSPPWSSAEEGPLAGVVVADFSRVLAGPYATMLLADMGATVVKSSGRTAGTTPAPGGRRGRMASAPISRR
jgi:crotonobetainyl-CoA:carnitine CoA-transferase CaiB-like acyl-CoA transferase